MKRILEKFGAYSIGYEGENIDGDVVVTLCIQLELGIRSFTLTSFPLPFYGYFFLIKKKN
jgi:hypothetical protein